MRSVDTFFLRGIVGALVTPLDNSERLDKKSFVKLLKRQLRSGIDAVFVLGSVGEGPMLPEKTRKSVIKLAAEIVDRQVPLLVGVMDNSTQRVLRNIDTAYKSGANMAVVTLPFYGKLENKTSIDDYFSALNQRTPLPLAVYNLPKVTGVDLSTENIKTCYELRNIVALKDTRDNLPLMKRIAKDPSRKDNLSYLPGNSFLSARLLRYGADGVVSVFANLFPELLVTMYKAHLTNDADLVRLCEKLLLKMAPILQSPTTSAGIKCALQIQGIGTGRTSHPWPKANESHIKTIQDILSRVHRELIVSGIL